MLIDIPDILTGAQVASFREALDRAEWVDGKVTAGHQSARAKHNMQVPEDSPVARQLGDTILKALPASPLFMSAALPLKVFPPLFNRYQGGQAFGTHIDGAIRPVPGSPHRVRTDLSATLFLTDPQDYDGGELVVVDTFGTHRVKLPAGHLVLYPASSLHHVTAVTRGARVCSFFWIQSMVRDDGERALLFNLDVAIQKLSRDLPDHPGLIDLTGVYNNLVRRWADA